MPDSQWEIENHLSWERRQFATLILTFCFLVPLIFVNLRKVSVVSVIGILSTALLVGVVAFVDAGSMERNEIPPQLWSPTLKAIGWFSLFSFAICAHSISPNFYQALEARSLSRYAKTTSSAYLVILIMNLIVGICGYWRFGNAVQANILEAYSRGKISVINGLLINIARV